MDVLASTKQGTAFLSPKGKCVPVQVVSFKVFLQEQKPRLTARYPFLTSEQITLKIKDQWKTLDDEKKQQYTKTLLKATPEKVIKSPKAGPKDGKRKRATPAKKQKAKKQKLDIFGNFPGLFCDEKHETSHSEAYENDFMDLSNETDIQSVPESGSDNSSVENLSLSQGGQLPRMKVVSQTYMKSKFLTKAKDVVPEVVGTATTLQAGILKSGDYKRAETKPGAGQGRVSFSSPAEISFSQSQTSTSTDYLQDSQDDNQVVLLTRESIALKSTVGDARSVRCPNQTEDDSDSDSSALLIRREDTSPYNFDKVEAHEMVVEEDDFMSNAFSNVKFRSSPKATKQDHVQTEKKPLTTSSYENNKLRRKDKSLKDSVLEEPEFKSPLATETKKGRKRKKSKTTTSQETPSSRLGTENRVSQVTPLVSTSQQSDSYTTPQMDEALQQLTLLQVSKAPQKHRQSGVTKTTTAVEKAVAAGRRVTRSLLSPDEKRNPNKKAPSCSSNSAAVEVPPCSGNAVPGITIDMKGDAGNKQARPCLQGKQGSSHTRHSTENMMYGNGRKQDPKNRNNSKRKPFAARDPCLSPDGTNESESPDQLPIFTSPESPASSVKSLDWSSQCNPALEKALSNLRGLAVVSPARPESAQSSPKLLSPALSGVSELSSGFNSEASQTSSDPSEAGTFPQELVTFTSDENPRAKRTGQDRSLCQMFQDITPPEKKTSGLYKTRRMVSSYSHTASRDIFQDESIF